MKFTYDMDKTERDQAESGRLQEALAQIVPALQAFNRFEGQDPAARTRLEWQKRLYEPLPETGAGLDAVLTQLADTVIPNGLRTGAPGFSGWVTTAPTTSGTVGQLAGMVAGSQRWWLQSFNYLETLALGWLVQLLELPEDVQGTFCSGGSIANLIGLGAARQWSLEHRGSDPARDGITGDRGYGIYASTEVHHVVTRAAAILGLGRVAVREIPVDAERRIRLDELERALASDRDAGVLPVAIVANAGTVNTGAVDPIGAMADLADRFETWLHVDGAYGLFARLDPRVSGAFEGLERAHSWAVDPHKWLAAPVGCGVTFVKDRNVMARAFTSEPAEYLEGSVGVDQITSPFDDFGEMFHDFNLEQSSPSRGVAVWAILKEIGAKGVRDRVIRHNGFARHLANRVQADENLELLSPVTLSICCFRYHPPGARADELDALNKEVARRLRAEGRYVPSSTVVDGRFAIRPCYINPRTRLKDVDGLADRVLQIGDEVASGR